MSHLRTHIRDAVVTRVTGLASTGLRVFKSFVAPQADVPFLLVTLDGREDVLMDATSMQERDLTFTVSGFVKKNGDVDADLDQIAFEVEGALAIDPTFGGHCTASWLEAIDSGIDAASLEQPAGRIDLRYRAKYFTHAGSPGTLS